jgi:hypothetical protein
MIAGISVTHKPHEQHLAMASGHVYVERCPGWRCMDRTTLSDYKRKLLKTGMQLQ